VTTQTTRMLAIALTVFFVFGTLSAFADSLSRRRAEARSVAEKPSKSSAMTNRRALMGPVPRYAPSGNVPRDTPGDSVLARGLRSAFHLDARGGGIHGAIGQHMASGSSSELAARRTAQTWQNGVGYTINAGRAAKYVGYMLSRP